MRKLFGLQGEDLRDFNQEKISFKTRLKNEGRAILDVEAFEEIVDTLHSPLRLTPIAYIEVGNIQRDFEDLFTELVSEPKTRQGAHPDVVRLKKKLREFFTREEFRDKIEQPGEIPILGTNSTIEAPYAFHNGIYHIVRPQTITRSDPERAIPEAFSFGGKASAFMKRGYRDLKAKVEVVLPEVSGDEDERVLEEVADILTDNGVAVVQEAKAEIRFTKELAGAHS